MREVHGENRGGRPECCSSPGRFASVCTSRISFCSPIHIFQGAAMPEIALGSSRSLTSIANLRIATTSSMPSWVPRPVQFNWRRHWKRKVEPYLDKEVVQAALEFGMKEYDPDWNRGDLRSRMRNGRFDG